MVKELIVLIKNKLMSPFFVLFWYFETWPKLALNSLCKQGYPQMYDSLASTSPVLGLQTPATVSSLCSPEDWTWASCVLGKLCPQSVRSSFWHTYFGHCYCPISGTMDSCTWPQDLRIGTSELNTQPGEILKIQIRVASCWMLEQATLTGILYRFSLIPDMFPPPTPPSLLPWCNELPL